MNRDLCRQALFQKLLGDRLATTIAEDRARVIMIASARPGDGKTTYFRLARRYMQYRYPGRYVFLEIEHLERIDPEEIPEHLTIIIDGPALNEGADSFLLPLAWEERIEAAILVVMGRSSTAEQLLEMTRRLQAMRIRCIGAVYNELQQSPQRAAWQGAWQQIMAWTPRANTISGLPWRRPSLPPPALTRGAR